MLMTFFLNQTDLSLVTFHVGIKILNKGPLSFLALSSHNNAFNFSRHSNLSPVSLHWCIGNDQDPKRRLCSENSIQWFCRKVSLNLLGNIWFSLLQLLQLRVESIHPNTKMRGTLFTPRRRVVEKSLHIIRVPLNNKRVCCILPCSLKKNF